MARKKDGVNKSEEIRKLLKANRKMSAKEIVDALDKRGIQVTDTLVYFIRGKIKGRRGRRRKTMAKIATVAGNGDAVSLVLKVKGVASEVGGLRRLKALVDAMSE